MKKVLHRSFKPAKCKTALQMANSRLKILRNKKEIQIKQLRRELAQLLESGQNPTARIRVEHVVREEKTVAAYELIGIYCELVVVRLGVIESQKTCPIDLKEAVTSVLFASQRLSDVPELSEIVKQFTAKYGKDFATSAIELRPDSGVSRLLVEKLSAKAPDGPTKVKILMEIAAEHNVVWEAKSFVEPDPKDTELLSGASSFQSASSIPVDSSRIPNKEQPPNVQAPPTVNVHHPPEKSSSRSSNVTSGKADDYYHTTARPSRSRNDEEERRKPNHGHHENSSSRSEHKWETEFVDSTEAARAAAEAAERASFAARAAAELSSKERMTRQSSTESNLSSVSNNFRNEPPPHRRSSSNVQQNEGYYSPRRNVRRQSEDMDRTQQDRYSKAKESEIPPVENSRKNDSFKQESEDERDHLSKQSSRASSRSHSGNYSDEDVIGSDYIKPASVVEENIFATEDDHRSQSSFKDIDTHDDATVDTFDDYSSFFDKPKFDVDDEHDHGVGFSLLGSKTSTATASWGFKEDHSKSHGNHRSQVFQESPSSALFDDVSTSPPASYYEPDPHAKFDNYDPNSETDDDDGSRHRRKDSGGVVEEKVNLTQKFEVSDPVGHEFFPLDKDDLKITEESDLEPESPTGLNFPPLLGGFRNKKTLPPYRLTPARNEPSSKSENEYIHQTDGVERRPSSKDFYSKKESDTERRPSSKDLYSEKGSETERRPSSKDLYSSKKASDTERRPSSKDVYSKKASNAEKRPSFTPPDPSSSDEDDSGRAETKTGFSHRHSHSEEKEVPTRSSSRSQERTQKPTMGMRDDKRTNFKIPASAWYEDEEEIERDNARINPKATTKTNTGFSLRTKGKAKSLENPSFPVTTKKSDNKASYDHQPSPKSTSEHKPIASSSVPEPDPETPSRDRPSHVHPNLPEFDDLFAKLGAGRARR